MSKLVSRPVLPAILSVATFEAAALEVPVMAVKVVVVVEVLVATVELMTAMEILVPTVKVLVVAMELVATVEVVVVVLMKSAIVTVGVAATIAVEIAAAAAVAPLNLTISTSVGSTLSTAVTGFCTGDAASENDEGDQSDVGESLHGFSFRVLRSLVLCVRHILRNGAESQLLQTGPGDFELLPNVECRQTNLSAIHSAGVVSAIFAI